MNSENKIISSPTFQGLAFDILFFFFSSVVMSPLSAYIQKEQAATPNINEQSYTMGWIYLLASVTQIIGALIKRKSFKIRNPYINFRFSMLFIIVMHWTLFFMLINDGLKFIDFYPLDWSRFLFIKIIFLGPLLFLLCSLPTICVLACIFLKNKDKQQILTIRNWLVEQFGNILLYTSACILTAVFCFVFMDTDNSQFAGLENTTIGLKIAMCIILFLGFLLLYTPTRFIFLAEDYSYPFTWIRISIIYIPFAWQLLFGHSLHFR